MGLWTDGVATKNDPVLAATLTFPDLSAQSAEGIDLLGAFTQELHFEVLDGVLVIHDVLVKDSPILIRLRD